jgi:hypothetical protein
MALQTRVLGPGERDFALDSKFVLNNLATARDEPFKIDVLIDPVGQCKEGKRCGL